MTDDRNSAEIEREIEEERHALARSLEELQATFSPERLMDQASGYMRANGGELAGNLVNQVKANPLAATMAGVGIAWLLASSNKRPSPVYDRNRHTHDPRFGDGMDRTPVRTDTIDRSAYAGTAYAGTGYTGAATYDDRAYPSAPGRLSDPYAGDFDARLDDATSDDPSAWEKAKMKAAEFTDDAKAKWLDAKVKAGMERDKATAKWDAAKTRAATARYNTQSDAADRWGATKDATSQRWREWQDGGRARMDDARARYDAGRARAYAKSAELRARLAEGTEGMSEQARLRVMRARQAAADAQGDIERKFGEYRASSQRMYDDQPLVGGLIALGVGAAVGALLPRTETEDHYLGSYRDRLFDEADQVFQDESRKLKAVADAALDEAKSVADEKMGAVQSKAEEAKGNTPYGSEAVDKVEGEVRSAAERIADRARDEAEKQGLGQTAKAEAEKAEAKADEEASRLHG